MLLMLLSPAKSLDFERPLPPTATASGRLQFRAQAAELMAHLREQSPTQLASLMGLSNTLASLNGARNTKWSSRPTATKVRAAAFAFDGPVYRAFDARSLDVEALAWAQQHIAILSGLYGVLQPLDPVQPHRLEMGTALPTGAGSTLYQFWGARLAKWLDARCKPHPAALLVNLASAAYFRAVDRQALRTPVLDCVFQQSQTGQHRVIGVHAKHARGLMARWVVQQRANCATQLRDFDLDGYAFAPAESQDDRYVFRRAVL